MSAPADVVPPDSANKSSSKVMFVVASFNPGSCGVSDYLVRLIGGLAGNGVQSVVVSIAQRHKGESRANVGSLVGAEVHRFTSRGATTQEILQLRDTVAPAVISFQFASFYGFNRKGLPVSRRLQLLGRLAGRCPLHIMFHEIWLEPSAQGTLRRRVIGMWQRYAVQRMIRALRPAQTHTTTIEYQTKLRRAGIEAHLTRLCGNVPFSFSAAGWTREQLAGHFIGDGRPAAEPWIFGLFGTIHPDCDLEPFMETVELASRTADRRAIIVSIGAAGAVGGNNLAVAVARHAERVSLVVLGKQSAARISDFLQTVDWGLATTAWGRCGKSSTVATMLDHGLPVLALQPPAKGEIIFQEMDSPLLRRFFRGEGPIWEKMSRGIPQDSVERLARQFIAEVIPAGHIDSPASSR